MITQNQSLSLDLQEPSPSHIHKSEELKLSKKQKSDTINQRFVASQIKMSDRIVVKVKLKNSYSRKRKHSSKESKQKKIVSRRIFPFVFCLSW
jgi:hypothetical protein